MNEKIMDINTVLSLRHIAELIVLVNNTDATHILKPYGIVYNDDTIDIFANEKTKYTFLEKNTRLIFTNNKNVTWILDPA